jgi:acyl-CoA synthetase (AMP-forming)/AMP-acid ligase II
MQNWFDQIAFHMRAQPETPAMMMEDRVVTYGMLNAGIDRCTRRLAHLGPAGDAPVAVMVENQIRHVTLCFALFKAGIPSISLEHTQSGIAGMTFAAVLGDERAKTVIGPGHRLVEITDEWFASDPGNHSLAAGFPDSLQICRMNLTSGTTGEPKTIKFTVADIGHRTDVLIRSNWNRLLCLPGLSTSWAFGTVCATLAGGGTLCFSASPFQSIRMIEWLSIDYVMASTQQLLALTRIAQKTGAHLPSLRIVETGGMMVTRALLESATIHVCKDIYCRYGASETGAMARAPARAVLARPGFAGYVLPGVEIVIVDRNGKPCPSGVIGSVRSRIDRRWDGAPPGGREENAGWIDLGDLGWMSTAGELYILGRAADIAMFDSQGVAARQISPIHEIEHIFRLEWDATDAAAVFADGDADRSKPQVWIAIVDCPDANAETFEAILRSKGIDYAVRLFPMSLIPRSVNGKINQMQLKSLMLASAGKLH